MPIISLPYSYLVVFYPGLFLGIGNWGYRQILGGVNMREAQIYIKNNKETFF